MLLDCPQDPLTNAIWRADCRDRAIRDKGFREAFLQACFDDPLFFFNAVLWVYEPRAKIKTKPFCLAAGTLVVTDRGPVPIENITRQHLLWDGDSWVSHSGALCMGQKSVISAYGISLTSDHKVWTKHGWQKAGAGYERSGVRLPDCYRERFQLPLWVREAHEMAMPLPVRERGIGGRKSTQEGENEELRVSERLCHSRPYAEPQTDTDLLHMGRNAAALLEPKQSSLGALRRSRHIGLRTLEVVRQLSGGHGREARRPDTRPHRQRRQLRTGELPLGGLGSSSKESELAASQKTSNAVRTADCSGDSRGDWTKRGDDLLSATQGHGGLRTGEATEVVYDILNSGPRHAFTVIGRDGEPLLVHNCLWPHQVPVILKMDATLDEAMEHEHPISLTVPKSRAQGATYIYLGVFIRRALKDPGFAAGLVTRNEELVDSRTDADAVMYKLAWMLDRLPKWMLPDGYQRNSTEHTIALPNGSMFSGYAATGDVARGGRKTAFAFDEPGSEEFVQGNKDYKIMSSVGSVSNCTFLVSTFGLDSGVFYESAMDPDNKRIVRLDWKDNPIHSKNAYVLKDGEAEAVRPEEASAVKAYIASHGRELKSIERRGHKMDGKVRSPWYDAHCLLPGGTPRFIARELDMDPRGAVGKLFDTHLLDTVKQRDVRAPIWQGKPVFDSESLKLTGLLSRADGPLKLWFRPGVDNSAPLGPFSVGCDIAMGSDGAYSSNSVASIIDDRTGEQVGEYTIMGMQSIVFARNVIGLCRWLRNAKLGWEDSGVSGPFAKEVMETVCYGNVYFREVAEIGSRKLTRKAGWRNGKDEDKADLFEKMALAMEAGKFTVRSEDLIRECGEYEWEKGKIVHRPTKNIDQSEKAHGDRCIAAGVAWLVYSRDLVRDRIDSNEETGETPEVGSYLWRERQEQARRDSDSPEFSIRDVMLTG